MEISILTALYDECCKSGPMISQNKPLHVLEADVYSRFLMFQDIQDMHKYNQKCDVFN